MEKCVNVCLVEIMIIESKNHTSTATVHLVTQPLESDSMAL